MHSSPPFFDAHPRTCAVTVLLLAATAAAAAAASPPAEDPIDLKFASFFRMPVGPRGLEVSELLRNANGRDVRLVGYMVLQEQPVPGRFLLTPRPLQMSEHADGDADDLPPATVTVLLDSSQRSRIVVHQAGLVALTGRLQVGRDEHAGRVSWFRLQLDPEAIAESAPASAVGRKH